MVMVGEEVEEGVADAASVLLEDGVTRPGVQVGVATLAGTHATPRRSLLAAADASKVQASDAVSKRTS
jgi:hypothetical protein